MHLNALRWKNFYAHPLQLAHFPNKIQEISFNNKLNYLSVKNYFRFTLCEGVISQQQLHA